MGPPTGRTSGPSAVRLPSPGGATKIAGPSHPVRSEVGTCPRAPCTGPSLPGRGRAPASWIGGRSTGCCAVRAHASPDGRAPRLRRRRPVLCLPRRTWRRRPRHRRGWWRCSLPPHTGMLRGRLPASRRGATLLACPPVRRPRGWRPRQDPGGDGRKDPHNVRYQRAPSQGVPI